MSYRNRRLQDNDSEGAPNLLFGDLTDSAVSFAGQLDVFNASTNVNSLKRNVGKTTKGGGNDEPQAYKPQFPIQ